MNGLPGWLFPGLWLVLLLASPLTGLAEVEVFELRNRQAQDLVQHLRPLYPEDQVSLSADGQRLVVRGEQPILDEIEQLVERLDVAPAQLRISLRRDRSAIEVQSPGDSSQRRVYDTESPRQQTLVLQDGATAQIRAGRIRQIPFAIQGGDIPALIRRTDEQLQQGLWVQANYLGPEQVELKLVSFDAEEAAPDGYETEGLVTIRRVRPGQWVRLGSTQKQARETVEQGGRSVTVGGEKSAWNLKVDLVETPGRR